MNFEHLMLSCIMPIGISKLSLCTFKKKVDNLTTEGIKNSREEELEGSQSPKNSKQ